MKTKSEKPLSPATEKFLGLIGNLNAVEFLGLAHLLRVPLRDSEGPRDASEILVDMTSTFDGIGRKQKREILRALKDVKASKKSDPDPIIPSVENGPPTESPENG